MRHSYIGNYKVLARDSLIAMVETNPVHPDLRRDVQRAMGINADVEVIPCTATDRDGRVRLKDGMIHSHLLQDYEVGGVSHNGKYTHLMFNRK